MTTFAEEFQRHLERESFERVADWYFSEEQEEDRIDDDRPYDELSPLEQAFFNYLNTEVFAKAIAEMRRRRRH